MKIHHLVLFCYLLSPASCRLNVLFLVADDMRAELEPYYGPDFPSPVHPPMWTPSLRFLAKKSLLLKRSYVQQAVCSPSRSSLLTGRRPDTTHVYDLQHYFRNVGGNFTTIPEYFKVNGYRTIGMGKIFHPGRASGHDDPISWTDPYFHGIQPPEYDTGKSWLAVPKSQWSKKPILDTQIADHAITVLRQVAPKAKSGVQPFFIAVGFHKPHLPFVFPETFLDNYPSESIRLPPNPFAPDHMPEIAWVKYGELRKYKDIQALNATGNINTTLPNNVVLMLRRAYYSALSYTDNELGRVIQELNKLGLANNTIISFWGDHGWQLGEHGEWCKHTNFELAVHAPMMIHVPGLTESGIQTEHLTEFVDLFPTLAEAAGLPPLPLCPVESVKVALCREGMSMVPLMRDPKSKWKRAAFSQYPRHEGNVMGYSIRTDKYRYTEWPRFEGKPVYKPDWSKLYGMELYDHLLDPEENNNRADDPGYRGIVQQLRKQLRAGWRYALPP